MLSAVKEQALLEAVRNGGPMTTILTKLGIDESAFYDWVYVDQHETYRNGLPASQQQIAWCHAFIPAVQRARAEGELELVERIRQAQNARGEHDWRADAFLLTHGPSRKRWYEHKPDRNEDPQQVIDAVYREVAELSDDDLATQLADLKRLPAAANDSQPDNQP